MCEPDAGRVYHLTEPTLGIHTDATGARIPITIPRNAAIRLLSGDVNGDGFCDIEWEGKRMFIFAIDLRERGEVIDPALIEHDSSVGH